MNVFLQELRFHRKTVLIWNVSLVLTLILMLFIYPAVMSEKASYEAILASLPPGLLEAFSIDFETFMSFNGFLGYTYTYMLIALGVLAMNLGLSALGKEVSGKTADFLMTRPISRVRLLTEKILAGITLLTLTNLLMVSQVVKKKYLFYLTPFRYFDFNRIIIDKGFELKYIAVSAAVIIIAASASYITLKQKEIHV